MEKESSFELGMIGLGTMGMNLLLNFADHAHAVAGYSRDAAKIAQLRQAARPNLDGFPDLPAFVAALRKPRVVLLLVPAGKAVDSVIEELQPLLEPGDMIVDAGNSFFRDTMRRAAQLEQRG